MPVKVRGANVRKDIEAILQAIEKNADGIRLVTFNTVKGQLTRRIFNKGEATEGKIGTYHPFTKKFRESVGRRTDTVDLEMTGTLRKSLTVGTAEDKIVLGILEQPEPVVKAEKGRLKIAGTGKLKTDQNAIDQEEHFKKEIFAPSKEELTRGEKTVVKEVNRVAQNALKSS